MVGYNSMGKDTVGTERVGQGRARQDKIVYM